MSKVEVRAIQRFKLARSANKTNYVQVVIGGVVFETECTNQETALDLVRRTCRELGIV